MKHRITSSTHRLMYALVVAGLLLASVPDTASAQRGRTDDGRRIERKSDKKVSKGRTKAKSGSASKAAGKSRSKATVQRGSNSRGAAVGGSSGRGGNARSGGAVRHTERRASGKRSGGTITTDRTRIDKNRGNRNDRRDWDRDDRRDRRDWDRDDRRDRRDWDRDDRRDRRDWDRRDNKARKGGAIYVPPGLAKKHVRYHNRRARRSHVDVRVTWPWVVRYEAHWHPRVRARHVIHVHVGSGSSRRLARMEFETVYRQRVRHANRDFAVIDIDIEEVLIYRDGRYVGRVDRIPGQLSRATATVWRNGELEYDRDIFVVGNSFTGFELISEEYTYDGRTRVRAGDINLRTGRVRSVSRPRLYDPYAPDRFYVQSLLPADVAW